ncbi:MAG: hypothetical protein HAW58_02195 [Candidatus Thioglobus sp.]|nr:hypothetical protein [Candidatus Thioglobus sp.]
MLKEIQNYAYQHPLDFNFTKLCDLLAQESYDLAEIQIKTLIKQVDFAALPFAKNSYSRSVIINNQNYWLGLLNWDKGATTRIHGHPQQAFVYVISGGLRCKNFSKTPLVELGKSKLEQGQYRYNKGIEGKMDNYIHQISAGAPSVSLHFYSDDPIKGEVFDL